MKRNIGQEILDSIEPDQTDKDSVSLDDFIAKHYPGQTEDAIYLRGIRARENMSQVKLAELTGIPQRHISEMENGKRPIGKERAKVLAKALNCDYRIML